MGVDIVGTTTEDDMQIEIEYGGNYVVDTVARTVHTKTGARVTAAKRVAKVLELADAEAKKKAAA
jgi:hypothetical protein